MFLHLMLKFWRYSDSKSSFSDEICYLGPDKNNVCLDTESWRCEALVFFFVVEAGGDDISLNMC